MKRLLLAALAAIFVGGIALAQPVAPPVTTIPSPRSATNASGSIAVTNTFQQIYASNNNRSGCTIQNNSASNAMYVYFGATADATTGNSIKLAAGQAVYCTSGDGIALTNAVQITGTATDAFYAASW